jgi:hypothetical protein
MSYPSSTLGKKVRISDKEFGSSRSGRVVKEARIEESWRGAPRYLKLVQLIEWEEPERHRGEVHVRFGYYDRNYAEMRRSLMGPPDIIEKLLNEAVREGILLVEKDTGTIRVRAR